MKLTHVCIITKDLNRLTEFYRQVLQIEPKAYGDDYVEFPTELGALVFFDIEAHERLAPGSARPASNRSLELEFLVEAVDQEYRRLQTLDMDWVLPPTTFAWGNRSIYFRDPDGNLVNLYSRV